MSIIRDNALRFALRMPGLVELVLSRKGEISLAESRFLGELVRRAPAAHPIIEIGTLFGASTRVLTMFKARETPLITVDSFRWNPFWLSSETHAQIARACLKDAIEHHRVELRQVDKQAFYDSYAGPSPGLVFLDARHDYEETKRDIQWARRVGAAVICGHDHSADFSGVTRAVVECGGAAEVVDTLFVMRPSS